MKTEQDTQPFYRQFWFWFVFTPLIVVVCVSLTMVTVAFRHADDVVIDNYYKEGRMINQTMEQDRRALELNLTAQLRFDRTTGEVFLQIPQQASVPAQLLLLLDHPFEADLDQQVVLQQTSSGHYRGSLEFNPRNNWYLSLLPVLDKHQRKVAEWLLSGDVRMGIAVEGAKLEEPINLGEEDEWLESAIIYLGGETPLGPVYLGYGFTFSGDFNIYFQLGAF